MRTHTFFPKLNRHMQDNHTEGTWAHTKAATVYSLRLFWITLFTNIRFLKSLRSTASLFSLTFTPCSIILIHCSHYSVWSRFLLNTQFSTKCFNLKPLKIYSTSFPFFFFTWVNLFNRLYNLRLTNSGLVNCTRMGQKSRVWCFKDPQHKSFFIKRSVLLFVCITTQASILAPEIG